MAHSIKDLPCGALQQCDAWTAQPVQGPCQEAEAEGFVRPESA